MREIELTQCQIVDLFQERLREHGSVRTGTYNKADPTHYEKGKATFGMPWGYNPDFDPQYGPEPENIEVGWHDCTWCVDYTFHVPSLPEPVHGQWCRGFDSSEFHWNRGNDFFFEIAKDILLHAGEPDFWDQPEVHKCYV